MGSPSRVILSYETVNEFSLMKILESKFPVSAQLHVTSRNVKESLEHVKTAPLLCSSWLINIDTSRLKTEAILQFCNKNNYVILKVRDKIQFEELKGELLLNKVNFQFVDRSKISDEERLKFIHSRLNIRPTVATKLNKKCKSLNHLVASVNVLSTLETVREKDIEEYVERKGDLGYYSVLGFLIDGSYSYSRILEFVYQYRYGIKSIVKFLCTELDKYIYVYQLRSDGVIRLDNVDDVQSSDDKLKKMSRNQILRIIHTYEDVSLEKLVLIRSQLGKDDSYKIYNFINILKVGGMTHVKYKKQQKSPQGDKKRSN